MSFDSLKQAIGNNISLPNGEVVKDIHFRFPVSFIGDCGKYTTCMLHDDEDVMTMVFMFIDISKLTCLELYITSVDSPTQTCAHPPLISSNSFNYEDLDDYLAQAMNLESSFWRSPTSQFIWLLFYYLRICRTHMCVFHFCVFESSSFVF